MTKQVPQLRTVGRLAAEVPASMQQVKYLLQKHNVQPIGRAGILRLYDQQAVQTIRDALRPQEGPPCGN